METIQVVLDTELLEALDSAARRMKVNRSALIAGALREHLSRLEVRRRELQDRRGYGRKPASEGDGAWLQSQAAWPER